MEQRPANGNAATLTFHRLKISYSTRCNATCDHCSVCGGPQQRETLDRNVVLAAIHQAADLGLHSIEFTGGEICLFFKDLLDFMECAHDRGLGVIIDTNAFWATTHDRALKRLGKLKQRGLKQIVVSTDRYHQAFIPLSRVVNALKAARELDISTGVTICHLQGDPSVLETVAGLHGLTSTIQFQGVAPFGRGAALPWKAMLRYPYFNASLPCKAVMNPAVGPDGRVTICCAPPLYLPATIARVSPLILGWLDREPLTQILLRAREDPFLNLLAAKGIAGIVDRINELQPGLYQPKAEGYFGLCDPCIEILGTQPLLSRIRALMPEVASPVDTRFVGRNHPQST